MTNDQFRNAPDTPVVVTPGTTATLEPNLLSSEELHQQRLSRLTKEVRRLYAWLGLLTGLSILSIGLLSGLVIWLNMQNNKLQQELSAINVYKAQVDQVKNLEARLNGLESQNALINQNLGLLNQEVPQGLPNQIKGLQNDISSLKTSIQKIQSDTVTRTQMEQSIQTALKNQTQNKPIYPSTQPIPTPPKK